MGAEDNLGEDYAFSSVTLRFSHLNMLTWEKTPLNIIRHTRENVHSAVICACLACSTTLCMFSWKTVPRHSMGLSAR